MKFTLPKKITVLVSIHVAAVGCILYILSYPGLLGISWLALIGFLLLVVAFILIILSLILKGL